MNRLLRGIAVFLALAACARPAAAMDPILMFVFSMAREMLEQNAARQAAAPRLPHLGPAMEDAGRFYPGTMVEPAQMRQVINDCFPYLSADRREEIFAALHAGLLDPKNAPMRAAMINHFTERAFAVRAAQQRLGKLSAREKEYLAGEFRKEVATLPPEEQERVAKLLREGLLPVPEDFNRLLLGAFETR
jgi:hypothetical protein